MAWLLCFSMQVIHGLWLHLHYHINELVAVQEKEGVIHEEELSI